VVKVPIEFKDNRLQVKSELNAAGVAWLIEAGGEIEAQTKRNSRVDTGKTNGSWQSVVDEAKLEAVVGSPLENAIWEEFGTGEHALNGDGRKGGWFYEDKEGNSVFTRGKKPNRALWNAFETLKTRLIKRAETIFKEMKT
jgi:hypothetical protein